MGETNFENTFKFINAADVLLTPLTWFRGAVNGRGSVISFVRKLTEDDLLSVDLDGADYTESTDNEMSSCSESSLADFGTIETPSCSILLFPYFCFKIFVYHLIESSWF